MRSYRTLIISVVVLAALAVPVCTTFGAGKPKAFHLDGVLATADLVFPGTRYDNFVTQALDPEVTTGDFVADRLGLPKQVVIQAWLFGLEAEGTYRIYLDRTGITAGDVSTAGPVWQLLGTVTADADGYVNFTWTSEELTVGDYQWSVFVNKVGYKFNYTELISDNMAFSIN